MGKARTKPKEKSNRPASVEAASPSWLPSERVAWTALALVVAVAVLLRWRLLDMPLDRDEGEYAYIAQQMLRGVPPYASGYAMKMPGIYVAYAVSMLAFGETIRGIHLGATLAVAASIVVTFLIGRALFNVWIGVAAAAMLALLSNDLALEAPSAQSEHFVVLPVLLGIWTLLGPAGLNPDRDAPAPPAWALLLAGVFFGTALVIKQTGFPFALLALWYVAFVWWKGATRDWRSLLAQLSVLALGTAIPFAMVVVAMYAAGTFDKFWFWTIVYAREYTTMLPLWRGAELFLERSKSILPSLPFVWASAAIGLVAMMSRREFRAQLGLIAPLLVFSAWAVSLGLYFRAHYFLLCTPVIALLAGFGCAALARSAGWLVLGSRAQVGPASILAVTVLVAGASLIMQRDALLFASPHEISRTLYGVNPFPESIEISRELQARMRSDDVLAVIGSEPQLYFYLKKRAPSPHIYMYPLMEPQPFALQMQHELARDFEQAEPDWVVFALGNGSWLSSDESNLWILQWAAGFLRGYERIGVVHIDRNAISYEWDSAALQSQGDSPSPVFIFRRKPNDSPHGA